MSTNSHSKNSRNTVLVVDDERQVLAAIEDTLEDEYRVLSQTSPEAAIRVVENEPELAVIMSDQRMPGMTGDQFLARARQISDASRMIITGYADLEAVIRAVNNGHIFGYISKPWNPEALKMAVYKAAEHTRLLRRLSEEQRLLHNLMDNIPDAIFFKDLQHRFVRLNRTGAAWLGVAHPEDALGRTSRDYLSSERALEAEEEERQIFRVGRPLVDKVHQVVSGKPGPRWISTTKAPIRDGSGRISGLVGIMRDVTERLEAEERIRRLNRVHAVLSGINSLIVRVTDREELYREACRIAVEAGRFPLAWIGLEDRSTGEIVAAAAEGDDRGLLPLLRLSTRALLSGQWGVKPTALRESKPVVVNDVGAEPEFPHRDETLERGFRSFTVLPLRAGSDSAGVLCLYSEEAGFFDDAEMKLLTELAGDISFALQHIEKSERLNYLAYYDSVTGLANRTLFLERLGQQLHAAAQSKATMAVAVVDLERFRAVNDSLGRAAGDELLRQLGERAQRCAEEGHVARLGADHFAVMLPDAQDEGAAARALRTIASRCLAEPFRVAGTELRVSAKSGIALFPNNGADAETLLTNAEAALRRAKNTGEPVLFYEQDMTARVAEKLMLENQLRRAVENEEFLLYYQPKVELERRRIVGLEALIRWRTPDGRLVPPADFIPLLEETGLILPVGAWAMRKAVLDHAELVRRGLPAVPIAVNVSAIQLRRRNFVDTVTKALEGAAASPGLHLEITESLLMDDLEGNIEKLNAVRALGVEVAIDDFGTGHSSLAYLAKLPVQTLKIDRSFVVTMLTHPDTMTLVQMIISLARSLKLTVVAEGVDSEEQAKVLRLLRCDQMQGYLVSKPVPLDAMATLLAKD